jgi:pimeloyl-ACP methyl ester carboxylesterase
MRLVFIHGSGGTAGVWKRQMEAFPDAWAVTLPGHPEGTRLGSVEEAAAWLVSEIDREVGQETPVVLVGHSLGGAIALQYALDHEGVAGLVLIGSGARLRVGPRMLAGMEAAAERPDLAGAAAEMLFRGLFEHVPGPFAEELYEICVALGPGAFLDDLRMCDRFDVRDRLGEIDIPTLAIVGTEDALTPPKYSRYLEAQMPDARALVIEGGTHFVMAEQPDRVNQAIADFIAARPTTQ